MDDIIQLIVANIDAGSTFKSARLISRAWLNATRKLFPDGHLRFANHLQTIIEKALEYHETLRGDIIAYLRFKKKFYKLFNCLSNNPNITWDFIKKHPELPWDLSKIMEGYNITDEIVDLYVNHGINDKGMLYRGNMQMSWESVVKLGVSRLNLLSLLPAITPEILERLEENWDELTSSWRSRGMMMEKMTNDVLATYGTEEVVMSRGVYNNQDTYLNPYLSCDFVLKHCHGQAIEKAVRVNFIQLHQRGIIKYYHKLNRVDIHINTSSVKTSYPDTRKRIAFVFQMFWDMFSCEVHQYVSVPCSKCATLEEVQEMIANNTINRFNFIRCNPIASDDDSQSLIDVPEHGISFDKDGTYIRYGSFDTIKKHFSTCNYSENTNVPLQYVLDHCSDRKGICRREDLTWDIITNNFGAKWIKFPTLWWNNFNYKT